TRKGHRKREAALCDSTWSGCILVRTARTGFPRSIRATLVPLLARQDVDQTPIITPSPATMTSACPMPPPGRVHYSLPAQTIRRRYRVRFELSEFPKRFVGELGLA